MSYNSFGAPEWALTPVGRTALEQALARYLSVTITVENVIFAEPDPLSSSVGADNGFAPRRGTVTTRSGHGDEKRIDLFFKIPREREVEAHVLGRRLGMQHQPRILVSSLDIHQNDVETTAFCYVYVPGKPLGDGADGNVFTADSLPPGIVADMALLHASTAGLSNAYLKRGYTMTSPERLTEEGTISDPTEYLDLPYVRDNVGAVENTLRRAAGVLDEAVSLATAGGSVVIHGEIEPRNIIIGPEGESTLVDWGDLGLGWAALDLAPCLGYDQISLYREKVKDRNPYWEPPGERTLAAARLLHSLINLKRLGRNPSDGSSQPPEVIKMWIERVNEALNRL